MSRFFEQSAWLHEQFGCLELVGQRTMQTNPCQAISRVPWPMNGAIAQEWASVGPPANAVDLHQLFSRVERPMLLPVCHLGCM